MWFFKLTGCGNGGFGLNCTQKCPDHCLNKTCDSFKGTCLACESGFTGVTCNMSKWNVTNVTKLF